MSDQIYQKLAQRLDSIPNGFPSTASGVELILLARLFSAKEALLASEMRLSFETARTLAARVGLDPDTSYAILKGMARSGLIRARKGPDGLIFALMPFVVGIYEEQISRMDAELASLFERYYQETRGGGITQASPAIHRIIPIETAILFELEIFPYEKASDLLAQAEAWGVRDCICRVQQQQIGKGCERPTNNCLVFAPVKGAFDHSDVNRPLTRDEAMILLKEAEEAGLVHSTGNFQDGHSYICNCCTCCCGILRGVAEFSIPTAVARADFIALVDDEICNGCGDCLNRCQFDALSTPEGICEVRATRCVGCGQCSTVCTVEAIHLIRRPPGDVPRPPKNIQDWMADRANHRGLSLADIL